MEVNIKCEKCGHLNTSEPEGRCEKCGDYLYQYYLKNERKAKFIKVAILIPLLLIGIFLAFIFIFPQQTIKEITKAESETKEVIKSDPVRDDLISYLKQIKLQSNAINNTDVAKNYTRNILGILDDNDDRVILAKLGLQEMPDPSTDKYADYWKEFEKKSQQIMKSKSLKEQFKIKRDYSQTESYYYSKITPITDEVESVHKYLIRAKELSSKAYENFINGMDLGYISNVKLNKDGSIQWSYRERTKEYSDNYKQYTETSGNEIKTYFRMLEQLVQKHNALNEYRTAFPYQGYMKKRDLERAGTKQ